MHTKIIQIENKIKRIKQELAKINSMRPGSLTKQYHNPKEKKGGYYQISYTHQMKSRTEYVKPQFVKELKNQIKNHKKFKRLITQWGDLAIQHSKLMIKYNLKMN